MATPAPVEPDEECTVSEAAQILGVSAGSVRRYEREGKIAARRTLGGQRRFQRSELERIVAAHAHQHDTASDCQLGTTAADQL